MLYENMSIQRKVHDMFEFVRSKRQLTVFTLHVFHTSLDAVCGGKCAKFVNEPVGSCLSGSGECVCTLVPFEKKSATSMDKYYTTVEKCTRGVEKLHMKYPFQWKHRARC